MSLSSILIFSSNQQESGLESVQTKINEGIGLLKCAVFSGVHTRQCMTKVVMLFVKLTIYMTNWLAIITELL